MKALHLIPYMHPSAGGPPVVVDRFCDQLAQRGWEVEVLTTDSYARTCSREWVGQYSDRYRMRVLAGQGPQGFGYSRALRADLARSLGSFDLVHVHNLWGYTNLLAASLCRQHEVPFVVSTHGMLDPHSVGRKWLKKKLYGELVEWRALRRAAGMIYTHAEEQRLAETSCRGLSPGYVVPLATDDPPQGTREELAGEFLDQFPACRDGRRVVFLGRLHAKKGLDLLIPAFARVAAEVDDARLILVGPGEPGYVRQLQAMVRVAQLEDRVTFTGSADGRLKWGALAASDLFVLPSYQENFAIAVVEALRMGTPVAISRRVNIWSDLVDSGAARVLELDSDNIAVTIIELLQGDPVRQSMAERGVELARGQYTWQRAGERLDGVYRQVLESRVASRELRGN